MKYLVVIGIVIVFLYLLLFLPPGSPTMIAMTHGMVQSVNDAIMRYHAEVNEFPATLDELMTNRMGIRFILDEPIDAWNYRLIYTPPSTNGPGSLGSYGADGKVGGLKENQDFFIHVQTLK